MADRCEICGGQGFLNYRVRKPFTVSPIGSSISMEPERDTYRSYPCPECCNGLSDNHVLLICAEEMAPEFKGDSSLARKYMRESIANRIARELLVADMIRFEEQPSIHDTFTMRGTLGVASTEHVASVEERVKDQLPSAFNRLADEITKSIHMWGSWYGDRRIDKNKAVEFIYDAVRTMTSGK